jgi:hypothetical protein
VKMGQTASSVSEKSTTSATLGCEPGILGTKAQRRGPDGKWQAAKDR